jgi:hypothetical protein
VAGSRGRGPRAGHGAPRGLPGLYRALPAPRRRSGEITRALRDPSPIGHAQRRGRRRWITAAAIVAGFGLLAGGEAILWRESKALVDPRPETTAEALSLLEEVTLLLSSSGVTAASVLVSDPSTVIAEMTSQESYEDDPIAGGGGRL